MTKSPRSEADERLSDKLPPAKQLRDVVESAPVALYLADADGRITYINAVWAAKVGLTAAEASGHGWTRALADTASYVDDPPWVGFTPDNSFKTRLSKFHRPGGGVMDMQVLNQARFDDDGQLVGFVGAVVDVTTEQEALRELAANRRRIQAILDFAPAGVFRADTSGAVTSVNPAFLRMTGLGTPEQALGSGWIKALHPEDRARVMAIWTAVVETGQTSRAAFRYLHQDGAVRHLQVDATVERDEGGQVTGFIGVAIDLTEQREAEDRLHQREASLALLAEHSSDAIFRLALDGRCIYASPASREVLGFSPEVIEGQLLLQRFHPDDEAAVAQAFTTLAKGTEDRFNVEFRSLGVLGSDRYHWLEANCRLIRDKSGNPIEVVASLRNIDSRKNLEAELIKAKRAAEAAAEAKAGFLSAMSHEIRTPMNGVLGFADLLLHGELTDEQRAHVAHIADSGKLMLRVLNDVLDVSRLEASAMELHLEPVDLHALVEQCVSLARPGLGDKNIRLGSQIDRSVPASIVADRVRLQQILLNLLSNAAKFTEEGEIAVEVGVLPSADHNMLAIVVRDTGIGISKEKQGSIFASFTQADPSIHARFGGSGLGLTICARLAALMGGHILLDSEPGRGSVFTLAIPINLPAAQSREASIDSPAVPSKGRVLVVEDNAVNQALIAALLDHFAVDYDIAGDGMEALKLIGPPGRAGQYDLVLMDAQLPRLDGLAATRRLRAIGHDETSLPIVALTAHASPEDARACISAGMQDCLVKPITLDTLTRALAHRRRQGTGSIKPSR